MVVYYGIKSEVSLNIGQVTLFIEIRALYSKEEVKYTSSANVIIFRNTDTKEIGFLSCVNFMSS